jgi:pimeloyl-ACP methyl ester carboxylesterase
MRTFARDGLTFDVLDSGTGERGTVLALHGFPQDASAYDDVGTRLVAAGLRVLAPDQRGYSPGARPTGGRADYAMRELVADAVALLDAAGVERAHVVGHDWGGAVAWVLAGRHPERVASLSVLSTPHPKAFQAVMWRSTQGLRSTYMALFQVPDLPERLALSRDARRSRRALVRTGLPAAYVDRYVERLAEPGALTAMLGWYRGIAASRGYGAGRTRVPTTYVVGRHDPFFTHAAMRRTRDFVLGDYRLVELDAGHWLPERHPAEVADAVLRRVRTAPSGPTRRAD